MERGLEIGLRRLVVGIVTVIVFALGLLAYELLGTSAPTVRPKFLPIEISQPKSEGAEDRQPPQLDSEPAIPAVREVSSPLGEYE